MGKSIATRAGNAKLTIIHVRTSTARETESAAAGFRMYSYPGIIDFICLFVSTSFLFLKNSVYFHFKSHLNICCNNYIALLPPQGFDPEAKTRGGIIVSPAYTYKECVNIGVVCL